MSRLKKSNKDPYIKLKGANMDVDLCSQKSVKWKQDQCPWNIEENNVKHKCAVKNISICEYFNGIQDSDVVLCSYGRVK